MIVFEDVHKYLLGMHILKGVSFKVKKGETFVIVGPTGTGKSVALRHIIGLHLSDSGSVIVDGKDVAALKGRELERYRSKFGVLFQSGALLAWLNVEDNIALPLREYGNMKESDIKEKVKEILKLVGLEDAAGKMPAEISGGMRKRAGLARAIVIDPEFILYDEPTSGLDPIMSRRIDSIIKSLKDSLNITSIVVTHDLTSAFSIADRVAMLHEGIIVECGTPDEFRASENKYVQEFIAAQSI